MSVESGTRVGSYEILTKIGEGGMGVVYRARDVRLGREVAIKILPETLVADPDALSRFEQEAKAVAALSHPTIVASHDSGESDGLSYVVLELLEGETLGEALARGALPLRNAIQYAIQLSNGLAAAHDCSIVHRDLKPANIYLTTAGQVKILDFGLAKIRPEAAGTDMPTAVVQTQAGMVMGTMGYMSPEQVRGEPTDHRTDLFSFGTVLYEMLVGARAFDKGSSADVISAILNEDPLDFAIQRSGIQPDIARILRRCLEKRRGERFQSARDLGFALETVADGLNRDSDSWRVPASGSGGVQQASGPMAADSGRLDSGVGSSGSLGLENPQRGSGGIASQPVVEPVRVSVDNGGNTDRGVTGDRILFGTTTVRSGPNRDLGLNMVEGMRTCFAAVNAEGGIHGRRLELVVLNDGYEPERARANMVELLEERNVFAAVGNVGTPTAMVTVPYAVENQFLFFGGSTGAGVLRKDPPERYVFNFRASYADETAAIIDYFVHIKDIPADGIAVFAQSDDYGDDGFRGVARSLRRYGVKKENILRVGYARNSVNVDDAVAAVVAERENVKAIVMLTIYRTAAQFIRRLKDENLACAFHAVSSVSANDLAQEFLEAGSHYGNGVIVTQVVPPPDSMATGVIRYRKLLNEHFPEAEPSYLSLEGFIAAEILVEGLRKVGADLTTEKLIDTFYTIKEFDLGVGSIMNFGPSRHQASNKVWATMLDGDGKLNVLDLDP